MAHLDYIPRHPVANTTSSLDPAANNVELLSVTCANSGRMGDWYSASTGRLDLQLVTKLD